MKLTNSNDFNDILNLITTYKQKAYKEVNKALIELYFSIGRYLFDKVNKEKWGKSVIENLEKYLKEKEPNIKGFTARNLWRMKQFYETYKDNQKLTTVLTEISWSNNLLIMRSTKTDEEREFYILMTNKERYTYRELQRQIRTSLYERTMLANKNFSDNVKKLPQDTTNSFRDSYVLEFLDLPKIYKEKDLQKSLISSLKDFILEAGKGFAFIGQEYKVQVGKSDFYIDLLFYHRHLRCLVAFELKTTSFKPEYLGQLEFYLEALDQDTKTVDENPSIGVLLCREKDDEVVKYALNRSISPTIISEYETKLIPKNVLREKLNELYCLLGQKDAYE
jgi:predicted nuclease of restriction endonuclease-like (RecB) superfamily